MTGGGPASGGGPQAGANGGGKTNSGDAGEAGTAPVAGAAGAFGLEVGTASVDVQVTVGERNAHVTGCGPHSPTDSTFLAPYPNGNREGDLICAPPLDGGLDVFEIDITALTSGLGEHDASELNYDCTNDGCVGVGSVVVFVGSSVISSQAPTMKSGTFTLDELSDRRMSGSLELTLSNAAIEVFIKGTFEANLLDCTTFPNGKCPSPSPLM
jgi:hypothetical protein